MAICIATSAALVSGCMTKTPTVEFVLPDGYRGKVILYVDRVSGVDLRARQNLVSISIPVSGVLGIKDDAVLARWHTLRARFQNGTRIPYAPNGDGGVNSPMLIDGSSSTRDGTRVHWCYIGTTKDYEGGVGIDQPEQELARRLGTGEP